LSKILIVDDVSIVRYRLSASLTRHGYAVVAEQSGPAALDLLRKDASITLVITDGPMAGCGGIDFLHVSQRLERHHDQGESAPPRVVLMTLPNSRQSKSTPAHYLADQARSFGFADVLLKPILEPALVACVTAQLSAPAAMSR
jgi:CheY-like chemotaxis protein